MAHVDQADRVNRGERTFRAARPTPVPVVEPRDHLVDIEEERETRGAFLAFILGGVMIAGGMLGFLYFDTAQHEEGAFARRGNAQVELVPARPSAEAAR